MMTSQHRGPTARTIDVRPDTAAMPWDDIDPRETAYGRVTRLGGAYSPDGTIAQLVIVCDDGATVIADAALTNLAAAVSTLTAGQKGQ